MQKGILNMQYLPTEQMVADILTKPLQGAKFKALVRKLIGMKQADQDGG